MYEFDLPYDHKTMHLSLDEKNFAGLMQGHQNEFKPSESQQYQSVQKILMTLLQLLTTHSTPLTNFK